MSVPNEDGELLDELNRTQVPAALFQGAVRALEGLGKNVSHFDDRIIALNRFFSEQGYAFREVRRLVKAVEFRVGALMRLREEHDLLGWGIPADELLGTTHDPYLAAAATEPLVRHGGHAVAFDPERFRARLAVGRAS